MTDVPPDGAKPDVLRLRGLFEALPALVAYVRGPEHVYEFANTAYLDAAGGRHLLGRPMRESLPELLQQGYGEFFDLVLRTGEPYIGREMAVRLAGADGRMRQGYFDTTYQPVRSPNGEVEGVLVHAIDVTAAVRSRQKADAATAELRAAEARYRALFETMTHGVVVHDLSGRIEAVNPAAEVILGRPGAELCTLSSNDPVWQARRDNGSALPSDEHPAVVVLRSGRAVRNVVIGVYNPVDDAHRWLLVSAAPRLGAGGETIGAFSLFEDITELRAAQAELQRSAGILDAVLASATVGFAFIDADLRFVHVNAAFSELSGRPVAEHEGRPIGELLPGLFARDEPIFRAILAGEAQRSVVDVVTGALEEGTPRREWLAHYYPVVAAGRIIGVGATMIEVTERNRLDRELADALQREQADRFRRAFDTMLDSVMIASPVWEPISPAADPISSGGDGPARVEGAAPARRIVDFRIDYVNDAVEEVGGRPATELVGRYFTEVWPGLRKDALFDRYVEVVETGRPLVVDAHSYRDVIDGQTVEGIFDVRATRLGGEVLMAWREVSERARRERELRDHREALAQAQRIAKVGSWRHDLSSGAIVWSDELYRILGLHPGSEEVHQEWLARLTDETMRLPDPALGELGPGMSPPGDANGAFLSEQELLLNDGTLRHVVVAGEEVVSPEGELVALQGTVQDITDLRAAELALAESQLARARERASIDQLQRAILPSDLPVLDGYQLGARYLAASHLFDVGGDWYDVYELPNGHVMLAVGDVAGKGVEAAETMGRLRNAARMCALMTLDPAEVITWLNRMVVQGTMVSYATAVYAKLDPASGELTWATAGHLPPLLRAADGRSSYLEERGVPPLGTWRERFVPSHRTTVGQGDAVVFYTDGLVERRTESLEDGLRRLQGAVDTAWSGSRRGVNSSARAPSGAAGASSSPTDGPPEGNIAELLCTRALDRVLGPETRSDDVCVLTIVRQARPRRFR